MASANSLQLWADDEVSAQRVAEAAIADALRIEAKYSRYRGDSVTANINDDAGNRETPIDAETAALLDYADHCYQLSGGLFDITSGALRRVWDFGRAVPRVPEQAEIAAMLVSVAWNDVEWSERTVRLPRPGMEIDFGGIGKEYAADRMAAICLEHGCAHALINLGGDIRAVGEQHDGTPWRVGIRHPRRDDDVVATVALENSAVATSGDYQRFFEAAGVRYCHILNARTGLPVRYWQSMSVIAPLCVVAGTCSTIAMLLEGAAETFLAAQGLAYLGVGPEGRVRRATAIVPESS